MLTQNQLHTLLKSALFRNICLEDLIKLLPCLKIATKTFEAEHVILTQGTKVQYIYIILEGNVEIAKENFAGQKNIVSILPPSHLFGEGIVCTKERISPVVVTALTPVTLLLIPYERIIGGCEHSCSFHHSLIHNMMILLGEKNHYLNIKMDLVLLKGMREKIVTYLLSEACSNQSASFTIHLNRNQLADYLNVSRTSMCRELGRMKEEGLIDYYQNSFKILDEKKLHDALSMPRKA
ncbi:MAG: Crp/Fnr family transcriptional regulator [Cellulosilyticum sp.]|nr:Crp/Fnr family transcriptional regulator [Cellulosilyticum sp.]